VKKHTHILIDDDKLMHLSWSMAAKKEGIDLTCFFSMNSFLEVEIDFSRDCTIYIDSDLGVGLKGEVLSEKLYHKGFLKLYLATGYKSKDFEKPSWIIDVIGKRPHFLL
jgi:FixJ family two-component response regulator